MAASSLLVPQSRLRSRNEATVPTRRSHEWPSRAASPCRAARASALKRRMACASCAVSSDVANHSRRRSM
eukprot:806630-Prymnesium_polylepis.1